MSLLWIVTVIVAFAFFMAIGWRLFVHRRELPCPSALAWLLDNPFSRGQTERVLAFVGLAPGQRVLDAGCGPGRFTVPAARAVGGTGRVTAFDLQERMLEMARTRVREAGLDNVDFLRGGFGSSALPRGAFDRALLVTVLGEVPDRAGAMRELFDSLKSGGILAVSEYLPDPHFQGKREVRRLAAKAGFIETGCAGGSLAFTMLLRKP